MAGEALLLQYGGLGIAAISITASFSFVLKNNKTLQTTIDKNTEAIRGLSEAIGSCRLKTSKKN